MWRADQFPCGCTLSSCLGCWLLQTKHFPFFIICTVSVFNSLNVCLLSWGSGACLSLADCHQEVGWFPQGLPASPTTSCQPHSPPLSGQGSGMLQPRASSSFAFRLPVCFRMEARWLNPIIGKGGVRISLPLSGVPRE